MLKIELRDHLREVWNKLFREETKRGVLGFLLAGFYLMIFEQFLLVVLMAFC